MLHEDPASPAARYEATRLGVPDESLWAHLAGDPERVLAIASRYMDFGMYGEALAVLDRDYPDAGAVREAGIPDLNHHAVAAYYKWFVRQALGAPAAVAHDRAMALPVDYVFPHGTRTAAILAAALVERPMDQTARYLLAMQDMQRGDVALAAARWDTVARAGSTAAGLWRNLGAARLLLGDRAGAEQAYEEGTRREPGNAAVWVGLDSVLALRGAPPGERATALDRYGDRARMPTHLVYRYAEVLAAAGRFDDADALFADRWFSRVEGGTNPRGVWTDVRSQRAVARAREGRCREARAVVAALGRPVPHRGFTNDGMQAFLEREPVQSRRQEVERLCGAGAAHGRAPLGSGRVSFMHEAQSR